jgi:hypothetical protein
MSCCFRSVEVSRHLAAIALAVISIGFGQLSKADALHLQHDDAFYRQLLKLPDSHGYLPTRSFTIIVDTEHGNQLVAQDDSNLRFNLLWMQQFQPGYRSNRGGSAFGEIFRSYLKSAYKSFREHNAQSMSALPDENGSIHARQDAANFIDAMDYNFKVTGDEVRFKVEYNY